MKKIYLTIILIYVMFPVSANNIQIGNIAWQTNDNNINTSNLFFGDFDNFTFINRVWNISNETNHSFTYVGVNNIPCYLLLEPNKWYNITEIYNITDNFTKCQSIQETPSLARITWDDEYNGYIDEPKFYSKPLTLWEQVKMFIYNLITYHNIKGDSQ